MNRAKLKTEEVTRIIIVATMTPPSKEITVESLLKQRRDQGFVDVGWHYFIGTDRLEAGVPLDERGSYVSRYSKTSVVVLLSGGKNEDGEPAPSFTTEQLQSLDVVVRGVQMMYPNAAPTMYRELFRGVNPVIDHEDYNQ